MVHILCFIKSIIINRFKLQKTIVLFVLVLFFNVLQRSNIQYTVLLDEIFELYLLLTWGLIANSADPDEMSQATASHLGHHYLHFLGWYAYNG